VPCGTLLDSVSCRKALLNADRLDLQAPDRRALDEVVFDVLGLTAGEREAVYEAVVNLGARGWRRHRACDLPQC
jgi:hypothetical protein